MKTRFAAALFALALPLCAQAPVSAETEAIFYKAFYLEKGPRDFAQAMTLYEQFLAKAPEHKLAGEAARQQFGLLDRLGKTKERDAFKEKYGKLIGDVAAAPRAQRPEPGADAAGGDRPARPGQAGGAGGPGGAGQRGQRGGMGVMGGKPLAEMNDEELGQFKAGLERMETMMERMRQNMTEEQQKALDANLDTLKKSLEAGKLEDAQKALDGLRSSFPQRRRGGEGGDAGGQGGPGGAGGGQARRQGGGEGGGEGGEGARPAQGRRGGGGGGGGN